MKLDKDYWETKEGNQIYPHEMTDEHLINTILYLHENVDGIAICYRRLPDIPAHCGGDAMKYAMKEFDREINRSNMEWLKGRRIYRLLMEEATKRGMSFS